MSHNFSLNVSCLLINLALFSEKQVGEVGRNIYVPAGRKIVGYFQEMGLTWTRGKDILGSSLLIVLSFRF